MRVCAIRSKHIRKNKFEKVLLEIEFVVWFKATFGGAAAHLQAGLMRVCAIRLHCHSRAHAGGAFGSAV